MMKPRNFRRAFTAATAALLLALPMIAGATTIGLSGTINNVDALSPIGVAVGDAVTGSFDVDLDAANSFAIDDLNFFDFAVGANQFDLTSGDFVNFSGALSADGSTVDAFSFLTGFVSATNGSSFVLAFDVNNQPFSITGFTGIGNAVLAANVADVAAVPEPRAVAMLSLALALLGLGVIARRRQIG